MKNVELPGFILPGVEDITRRDFLVGGAAALFLAGCGNGGGDEGSGGTRTVEDGKGRSVEVPGDPQRVVVVDPHRVLFHLVQLGLVPVGATRNPRAHGGEFPALLGELEAETGEIESVGDTTAPSLERIAALEPDLVFYTFAYETLNLEDLSGIAPTVAYDVVALEFDLPGSLRFVAEAVNRRQEAERITSGYETKLEEAASNLDLGGRTFSVVEGTDQAFYLMGTKLPVSQMIERFGGRIVPEVDGEPLEGISGELSLEAVPEYVEAETILSMRYLDGGEMQEGSESFAQSAVWRSLPAVERGEVIALDSHAAFGSYGYLGARSTLDKLVEELGERYG